MAYGTIIVHHLTQLYFTKCVALWWWYSFSLLFYFVLRKIDVHRPSLLWVNNSFTPFLFFGVLCWRRKVQTPHSSVLVGYNGCVTKNLTFDFVIFLEYIEDKIVLFFHWKDLNGKKTARRLLTRYFQNVWHSAKLSDCAKDRRLIMYVSLLHAHE